MLLLNQLLLLFGDLWGQDRGRLGAGLGLGPRPTLPSGPATPCPPRLHTPWRRAGWQEGRANPGFILLSWAAYPPPRGRREAQQGLGAPPPAVPQQGF